MNEERFFEALRAILQSEKVEPVHAVTFEEAARRLSCSPRHIGRLVKTGQMLVCRIGDLRRIPVSELTRLTAVAQPERQRPTTARVSVRGGRFSASSEVAKLKSLRKGWR